MLGLRITALLALVVPLIFASLTRAQYDDDDVSAQFDYDGVLMLESSNFRGMTQSGRMKIVFTIGVALIFSCPCTGIWVVLFYSYSVVIKNRTEAYNCQRIMWMWGDFATRANKLGGTPSSGEKPTIHIAKYDTTSDYEREFASMVLGSATIESLPAIVIFDGKTVRLMPQSTMDMIIDNFPDIDRLEGYSDEMKCDPPADYFVNYGLNLDIMSVVSEFINDHLLSTRGIAIATQQEIILDDKKLYSDPKPPLPPLGSDWNDEDPTEEVLEVARAACRTGNKGPLRALLTRLETINGTGVDCRDPYTMQTPLHFAAVGGENEVVDLLLSFGADPNAIDGEGDTVLHKAAEHGRRGVMRSLLRSGARISAGRECDGATPLHMAAMSGHPDLCRLLLLRGADVEARTPRGWSPLHFAASSGHWLSGATEELLRRGADIDARDNWGQTPLVRAMQSGSLEMSEFLLEQGAKPDVADFAGDTALHLAIRVGWVDMLQRLLRRGANPRAVNRRGEMAMDCMSEVDNWKKDAMSGQHVYTGVRQAKLEALLRPFRFWWWPGFWVGPYKRVDLRFRLQRVEKKLRAWLGRVTGRLARYFQWRWRPLARRVFGGWLSTSPYERFTQERLLEVEEFLDKQTPGGDNEGDIWLFRMGQPDFERLKSYTELQRAVVLGQHDVAEELLSAGVAPWARTARGGPEADMTQILLPSDGGGEVPGGEGFLRDQGGTVDIEVRDERGATPLVIAAARGDLSMVELLGRWGADPDAVDDSGQTALKRAAGQGRLALVELLLRLGASPDQAPAADGGRTALMAACASGHREVARALLREGAFLDRVDASGRTALNHAASAGTEAAGRLAGWLGARGAVMRTAAGDVEGFDAELDPEETPSYSPVDEPERDRRNPRFTGVVS